MNITDKLIRSQLELTKPIADGTALDTARSFQDRIGKLMHFTRRRDVVVQDGYLPDIRGSLIIPRDEIRSGIILYLHGGGYACGTLDYARGFAAVLSAECGMRSYALEYSLAPEKPYPAAPEDALEAYLALIDKGFSPESIIVAGESAGGGLAYSLCRMLLDRGLPTPAGIIAISPWCDLTLSGESYAHNKEADPSITYERLRFFADCYVGGKDLDSRVSARRAENRYRNGAPDDHEELMERKRDPMVSPLFADLTGMPPSLIFVGEDEILLSDALSLSRRLTESGATCTLYSRPEMWHAYVLYCLKSNKGDFDRINEFLKKVLPDSGERKLRWMHLDNSAKIYPASASSRWNNIYRLSATLTEDVDREVLQSALDVTVRRFPSIAVRLHRGMFWYYLEEIDHAPRIKDEGPYPLKHMPFDDIRSCAFRVLVYKKRIAVEFFHALTDGNGGLVFLKTLLAEYITEKYGETVPCGNGILDRLEPPSEEELEDSFPKHKAVVGKSRSESDSYRVLGTPEEDGFCTATTMMMNTEELLTVAHGMGVTLTELLAAMFIKASIALQEEDVPYVRRRKKVKVLIPCDLRRLYGSRTLRNFVLYSTPGVDPRLGEYSIEELARIVHHRMALDITEKNMGARIYTNVHDEERLILKLTPLFIKNIVMKAIFMMVGEKKSALSVSNLGLVRLPEEMSRYIERFDFVLSVQSTAPYNAGVISYRDTLYLNLIRNIKEPRLEMALYRVLRELGIKVKVESNGR